MNTGAKYDSKAFKKSVGLNGVGVKAVNALSSSFVIRSYRDGQVKAIEFDHGNTVRDEPLKPSSEENGTEVIFRPDQECSATITLSQSMLTACSRIMSISMQD